MDSRASTELVVDPLGLLPLAVSQPQQALRLAEQVLAGRPAAVESSVAHHAIGIVLRDFGDLHESIRHLRLALRFARVGGSTAREADVRATLGIALVFSGKAAQGRSTLDLAVALSRGSARGRILMRRGSSLLTLGEYPEALRDLDRAVTILHEAHDRLWEPRALTARAFVQLGLGLVDRARSDLAAAERLLAEGGQLLESARARENAGVLALREGDLPAALACLDAAEERFAELGVVNVALSLDRCDVLRAAGMPAEALMVAESALRYLDETGGSAVWHAEILLAAAVSALETGDPTTARDRAAAAAQKFRSQGRPWWHVHARLVVVRARFAQGEVSTALLRAARRCVADLEAVSSTDASLAHLVAGRIASGLGRDDVARGHLAVTAAGRGRGAPAERALGWLAVAVLAEIDGDTRGILRACRRGLEAVEELRGSALSSELRAHVTLHGAELATLALSHVLRRGRPRELLRWSDRTRAGALTPPPVRPPADPQMRGELAALREIASRLTDPGAGAATLRRQRARLERTIRARALRTSVARRAGPPRLDIESLCAELGPARLVQLVDVHGELHVLVVAEGRVRRFQAGRTAAARRGIEMVRFGLRRMAHGRGTIEQLEAAGSALMSALLAAAAEHLGGDDLVIVPPGVLHAVPWAVLPVLRDRAVSVAPSATAWLRARRGSVAPADRIVLVHGPGLSAAGPEVAALAAAYPGADVLGAGSATVDNVLGALDGAGLAHIAAHGRFRADSPLFSALQVDDGWLTVHDLEQLQHAPRRLVLPCCDSGLLAPAGTDELLGLISSLLPLGTAGVIAAVVPIDDTVTATLMTRLHEHLRAGATMAEALRRARPLDSADPVELATAWSFVSLGDG